MSKSAYSAARRTRFKELGYEKQGENLWRIIDLSTSNAIGPHYGTEGELLSDLDRFAEEFGCGKTTCKYRPMTADERRQERNMEQSMLHGD